MTATIQNAALEAVHFISTYSARCFCRTFKFVYRDMFPSGRDIQANFECREGLIPER